jgi:hypothetical protein
MLQGRNQEGRTMDRQVVIKGNANQTAAQIALLSPDTWCKWICYLLQELDSSVVEDRYHSFLQDMNQHIIGRLEKGNW